MGKMGLAGVSLAAAIPGGVLFVVMLMAVLNSLEPMPTILKVAALSLLVLAALIMLFPAYILIWYRGPYAKNAAIAGAGEPAATEAVSSDEFSSETMVDPSLEAEDAETGDFAMPDELENDEFVATESGEYEAVDSGEFEEFDGDFSDETAAVEDFDEVDFDEELQAADEVEDDFEFEAFDEEEDEDKPS